MWIAARSSTTSAAENKMLPAAARMAAGAVRARRRMALGSAHTVLSSDSNDPILKSKPTTLGYTRRLTSSVAQQDETGGRGPHASEDGTGALSRAAGKQKRPQTQRKNGSSDITKVTPLNTSTGQPEESMVMDGVSAGLKKETTHRKVSGAEVMLDSTHEKEPAGNNANLTGEAAIQQGTSHGGIVRSSKSGNANGNAADGSRVAAHDTPIDRLEATREILLQKFQQDVYETRAYRESFLTQTTKFLDMNDIQGAATILVQYLEKHLSFDYFANPILARFISAMYMAALKTNPKDSLATNTKKSTFRVTDDMETVIKNVPFNEGVFTNEQAFNEILTVAKFFTACGRLDCANDIIMGVLQAGYTPSNNILQSLLVKKIDNSDYQKLKNRDAINKTLDVIFKVYPTMAPLQISQFLMQICYWIIDSPSYAEKYMNLEGRIPLLTMDSQIEDEIIASRIALYLLRDDKFRSHVIEFTHDLNKYDTLLNNERTANSTDGVGYYYLLCATVAEINKNFDDVDRFLNILAKINLKNQGYYELKLSSSLHRIDAADILECLREITSRKIQPTKRMTSMLLHIIQETNNLECFALSVDILATFNKESLTISQFTNALNRLEFTLSGSNEEPPSMGTQKEFLSAFVKRALSLEIGLDITFFEQLVRVNFKLQMDVEEIAEIFTVMRELGYQPDMSHYTAFMEGVVKKYDLKVAQRMFDMIGRDLNQEELLLCRLIAFYNAHEYTEVNATLSNYSTDRPIPVRAFNIGLDSLMKSDKADEVPILFRKMYIMGTGPNTLSYILLYRALAITGNTKSLARLYTSQTLQSVAFDKDLAYTLLHAAAYCNEKDLMETIIKDMRQQFNIPIDPVIIQGILEGYKSRFDHGVNQEMLSIAKYSSDLGLVLTNKSVEDILETLVEEQKLGKDSMTSVTNYLKNFIDYLVSNNHNFSDRDIMSIVQILGVDIFNISPDTPPVVQSLINNMIGDKDFTDDFFFNPVIVAGRIRVATKFNRISEAKDIFNEYVLRVKEARANVEKNRYMDIDPDVVAGIEPFEAIVESVIHIETCKKSSLSSNAKVSTLIETPLASHVVQGIMRDLDLSMTGSMANALIYAAPFDKVNSYSFADNKNTTTDFVENIVSILDNFYKNNPGNRSNLGLDVRPCRVAIEVVARNGTREDLGKVWSSIVRIQSQVYMNQWQMQKLYGGFLVALAQTSNFMQGMLLLNSPAFASEMQDVMKFKDALDSSVVVDDSSTMRAVRYLKEIEQDTARRLNNRRRLLCCLPPEMQ